MPPWPDLVIGAGRRSAPVVAALRRWHGIAAVQLLDPGMSGTAFDAVIVPEHDRLRGANVLTTVGALSAATAGQIAAAGDEWAELFDPLPHPRLAVLVGGPSKSARFTSSDETALVSALKSLAVSHRLMITPSRRTTRRLVSRLAALPGFCWDGTGANPYPGLLHHADAVLVTADSVNMASEAAATGRPVHVFPVTGLAPKLRRFHRSLEERGAARSFAGEIADWSYPPLAEPERIAGELVARGLW